MMRKMYQKIFTQTIIIFIYFQRLQFAEIDSIYHVSLNEENTMGLNWVLDYPADTVIFEVHIPDDYGWFAIGFSDRGKLFPADYCVLWKDLKSGIHFQDTWADDEGILHVDKHQNCNEFQHTKSNGKIKFTYRRKFDTCDPDDYVIDDGTTHVVWTAGKNKLYKLKSVNITTLPAYNGMVRVHLLKNINVNNEELPPYVHTLDIFADNVHVPAAETTYWCHVHKLPDEYRNKHHIYRYESHIPKASAGVVHHMEVFHCEAPVDQNITLYKGSCFANDRPAVTQVCKRVLAAWAMGAPPFTYPEEASLPIGGDKFNPFIMLEVHYNNPGLKSGIIDSSGIRFHVSSKLKEMDAGVMELGLEYTDKMAIPPGQTLFQLSGYCVSECTAVSLPQKGITVFGSQLHTHLTGVKVRTRHIRDGVELAELDRDNHFSTHFQEIRRLKQPVKILPGDALITTCDYNTEDRDNVTLGGFAITDEMCVNYVHYFPATDLEVCKSSISDGALQTYFSYMNDWEGQSTRENYGISDNYKAIEWNRRRVQFLDNIYTESPLSMQCNMSNGDKFPGYWDNTPVSTILSPLPPRARMC